MKNLLVILLSLFAFCTISLNAQEVSVKLKDKDIKIGEQTKLFLEMRFPVAAEVMFPSLKDTISKFIQIVEISTIDTSFDEDDVKTKILSQELTITSFDSGHHVILPMKFAINGDSLESQALMLSVQSVKVPENADLSDIKGVLDVPFSFWEWLSANKWYFIGGLLLIGILLAAYFIYKKYRDRPKAFFEKTKPLEPAHIIAERKLQELKSKKAWENYQVKAFHVEISYIIREYLENRFGSNSLDETTDEILHHSQEFEIETEDRQKLAHILTLADMAKFAKQEPSSFENEQSLKNAEIFVASTKMEIQEEKELSEESDMPTQNSMNK